ncbi:MAG: Pyocin activator protein PrtN [Hyphomicrobiales bacterium]|nr:MAG: Pyocin activator protein PrtN [Hyphomicrobiales bacterium]
MNTSFLLMAQYEGLAVIPVERVRKDYFAHLNEREFVRKLSRGDIPLPMVRMDESQKTAKGVHLVDLATYLDKRRAAAERELRTMTG